jgi:hypothetical protein
MPGKQASPVDATAIGIAIGISATLCYALARGFRQGFSPLDLVKPVLIFLPGFSLPGSALLIAAALSGNQAKLPSSWREHIAVAGIVAISLSAQFLIQSFRDAWSMSAPTVIEQTDQESQEKQRGDSR